MKKTETVSRPTMWCRQCWYILDGLDESRCPECGRPFDPMDPRTYRRTPPGVATRVGRRLKPLRWPAVAMLVAVVGFIGWYWWRYTVEQRKAASLDSLQMGHAGREILPHWAHRACRGVGLPYLQRVAGPGIVTVRDGDLKSFKEYDWITVIAVDAAQLTDAGLTDLKGVKGLQELVLLNSTNITDSGLAHVQNLGDLWCVQLSDARNITDVGLAHLQGLTRLRQLSLKNSQVTDAGLTHLKGLRELQHLRLNGSRVTKAGIANLKQALPNLHDHVP